MEMGRRKSRARRQRRIVRRIAEQRRCGRGDARNSVGLSSEIRAIIVTNKLLTLAHRSRLSALSRPTAGARAPPTLLSSASRRTATNRARISANDAILPSDVYTSTAYVQSSTMTRTCRASSIAGTSLRSVRTRRSHPGSGTRCMLKYLSALGRTQTPDPRLS